MKIIAEVAIVNFIKYIQLTKTRRPVYYKNGDKVPKKYSGNNYGFEDKEPYYLINIESKERVLKNKVDKPRILKIRGQEVWSGMSHYKRSRISKDMKLYFYEKLSEIKPLLDPSIYPIGIRIDVYDHLEEGEDLDNFMLIYRKTIHDALCGNVEYIKTITGKDKKGDDITKLVPNYEKYPPILIDDDKKHIQEICSRFYPVDESQEPVLFIQIYSL